MSNLLEITLWTLLINYIGLCDAVNYQFVTCGSVIKLINPNYKIRLHSHDIKYGSGSGQQSVTGTETKEDINSYWTVKGKYTGDLCQRGEPIECGQIIRLEHVETQKNLHSHHFSSPLSGNQEVSAFGTKGDGDTGDNWTVVCTGDYWERGTNVRLKHVDTEMWLSVSGHTYGRPIHGQIEIVGSSYPDPSSYWKTMEGIYLTPNNFKNSKHTHDEF